MRLSNRSAYFLLDETISDFKKHYRQGKKCDKNIKTKKKSPALPCSRLQIKHFNKYVIFAV